MRIVIRSLKPRTAAEAQERVAAAGFDCVAFPGPAGAGVAAAFGEAALVVVPEPDGDPVEFVAFAAALREKRKPLATLAGLRLMHPPPTGLVDWPPFSGAVALDAPCALLEGQIQSAIRAAVAAEERERRALTAASLGAPCPANAEQRLLKALYIGAPSPQFLELERAFSGRSGLTAAAFTSFAGFDHLHDEYFDAVVLNGSREPNTAIALCAALRRNAALHHLPTLVILGQDHIQLADAAIARGASAVVAANEPTGPSLAWLLEAIRRERKRRAAEHEVRALRDLLGDPRTGLMKREPFEAHLARMADDHHASGRPLGLIVLKVLPAHGARPPAQDVWKRGFGEVCNLAARLVRDTDSAAALGRDLIAAALPLCDLSGARRTAERVASVAECTAFASGEAGAPPLVFEQSAVELQPGESGAALLARASRALEDESISA